LSRFLLLIGALVGALLLASLATRPTPAAPATVADARFSAERAMADVRVLAAAPRPTGSPESARARAYLVQRLKTLGLETGLQTAPLSEAAIRRLGEWGLEPDDGRLVNVVGRLRGTDSNAPAVALTAHYDTVAGSPGAADDGAGVAAVLEVLRALRSGPPPRRDVVVVFTDAEELTLDGAEAFFAGHPLAPRIGAVINLEARGGAGRALMFETGPDNGEMIGLFARSVRFPSAQSLAVLIYRLMPNSTDFTVAKRRGLAGFNFAFMGGADQYHSPTSTADALSRASLQHLGAQVLDVARALAHAQVLPGRAPDLVFSDVLGLFLIVYPAVAGWALIAIATASLVVAGERARRAGMLDLKALAGGAGRAVAVLLHAALALELFNRISGAGPDADYFDRLAALPRLEVQAALVGLGAIVGVLGWRPGQRFLTIAPALLMGGLVVALRGGIEILGLAALAAGLWAVLPRRPGRAEWLGAILLLLLMGAAVQAVAPTAAPLLVWPLTAAAAAAAATAPDPTLPSRARAPAFIAAVIAGGQVLAMAHLAFLGVGPELATAMAVFVLLVAILVWPLAPKRFDRRLAAVMAVLVVASGGLALSVRLDPPAASAPIWLR
jgi:hypothetical protein